MCWCFTRSAVHIKLAAIAGSCSWTALFGCETGQRSSRWVVFVLESGPAQAVFGAFWHKLFNLRHNKLSPGPQSSLDLWNSTGCPPASLQGSPSYQEAFLPFGGKNNSGGRVKYVPESLFFQSFSDVSDTQQIASSPLEPHGYIGTLPPSRG